MTGDKKQQGFSLIELIVVLGIFSTVITVVIGSFLVMLQAQRAILAEKDVAENARFALEYMARQMRVVNRYDGAVGQPVGCVPVDTSFDSPSANEIFFLSQADECLHFFVQDGVIQFENDLGTQDLTSSSEVFVEDLTFVLVGEAENDSVQPRITISITARGAGQSDTAEAARATVQTTVGVRNLDIPGT
jgi:prepilin-type N-terminal cleavage/methylation domain-containing protein